MTRKGDRLPLSPRGAWPWCCPQGQHRDRRLINNIAQSQYFQMNVVSSEADPLDLSKTMQRSQRKPLGLGGPCNLCFKNSALPFFFGCVTWFNNPPSLGLGYLICKVGLIYSPTFIGKINWDLHTNCLTWYIVNIYSKFTVFYYYLSLPRLWVSVTLSLFYLQIN